ncbi:CDP-alcohol phosphatidyltransferase family protein [Kiloniella laminariae]|uniref:CDP-alcohol phosphatidyltransferase family protein n=1 Tax=Kiloniella laminariae TaxID=454162 RepID=A0ABT4LDI3_9PROT|nr:CDP-alcohol phosphatidyltransferase family protein [Kiloniella laminariae]MCZ4279157.1 CDP-alcohol phosphatidyltransferase family protein [Kiloniella laminariae]
MITIYDLKPQFQNLLRPICARFIKIGLVANHITLAALILSGAGGIWIALAPGSALPLLALPVLLFIRMALNAVDGMMAREFNQKSRLGAVLNELGDVLADVALYLPFALIPGVSAVLCTLVILLGIIVEMTGIIAVQIGASRRYDGPFGKSDRAFAFGLLAVLLAFDFISPQLSTVYLAILIGLSCYTLFNRAQKALREADESTPS